MKLFRFISNNILFKFDPEFIHDVTQVILSNKFAPYLTSGFAPRLPIRVTVVNPFIVIILCLFYQLIVHQLFNLI